MRDRALRLVLENEAKHRSRWQAIVSIAGQISSSPNTLSERLKKAELDSGERVGIPGEMAEKVKALGRECCELLQANDIACKASV